MVLYIGTAPSRGGILASPSAHGSRTAEPTWEQRGAGSAPLGGEKSGQDRPAPGCPTLHHSPGTSQLLVKSRHKY